MWSSSRATSATRRRSGAGLLRASGADVFHLAGIIHPRRIRDLYEINTEGTRHVIAAARAAGVRRLVATSSNSPAGVAATRRCASTRARPTGRT